MSYANVDVSPPPAHLAAVLWPPLAVPSLNLHQEVFAKRSVAHVTEWLTSSTASWWWWWPRLYWCESATGTESTRSKHQETAAVIAVGHSVNSQWSLDVSDGFPRTLHELHFKNILLERVGCGDFLALERKCNTTCVMIGTGRGIVKLDGVFAQLKGH